MSERSDIEIVFSDPAGAFRAREIARMMSLGFVLNGYEYLPFDDMRKVNADGWVHYPERYVRFEEASSFRLLWMNYQRLYRRFIREKVSLSGEQEEMLKMIGSIRKDGCRFLITDRSGLGDDRQIEHQYYQDFFSMLCFLLAVKSPDTSFEGLYRSFEPCSYQKRILNHAVFDGNVLSFEQMEGDPVYGTELISWTRVDDRFMKCSRRFPFIRVDLITEDSEAVKQDQELNRWVSEVNKAAEGFPDITDGGRAAASPCDSGESLETIRAAEGRNVRIETACAELCFRHASYPYVMLHASCRELCVKKRDALVRLLSEKGYSSKCFSILYADECTGSDIQIPDSVTKIGDNAFRKKRELRRIVISENVTEIGEYAFQDCLYLEEAVIPEGVRKIEDGAFRGCRSLESIVIPETVTEFGPKIFQDCSPDLVIRGKKDSRAERYATENGIAFAAI